MTKIQRLRNINDLKSLSNGLVNLIIPEYNGVAIYRGETNKGLSVFQSYKMKKDGKTFFFETTNDLYVKGNIIVRKDNQTSIQRQIEDNVTNGRRYIENNRGNSFYTPKERLTLTLARFACENGEISLEDLSDIEESM